MPATSESGWSCRGCFMLSTWHDSNVHYSVALAALTRSVISASRDRMPSSKALASHCYQPVSPIQLFAEAFALGWNAQVPKSSSTWLVGPIGSVTVQHMHGCCYLSHCFRQVLQAQIKLRQVPFNMLLDFIGHSTSTTITLHTYSLNKKNSCTRRSRLAVLNQEITGYA